MDDSIWALLITLFVDFLIFSIEFYLFSVYRKVRNKPVYLEMEGKDIKVPVFSESDTPLWNLMRGVWNVPYEEMGFYCGLEGKLYLALHVVLAKLMIIMCLIGCSVLIPVYVYGDASVDKLMNVISMAHIIDQENLMSVVLVYFVLFTFLPLLAILLYIREVSKAYSMPSELICTINKYSLEIRGLPQNISPNEAAVDVKDIIEEQFPKDVLSVYVVPNLASAFAVNIEIEEAKKELLHYQEYLKHKGTRANYKEHFCAAEHDAIVYFQEKINLLNKKMKEEVEKNKNTCAGYAYVVCKNPLAAYRIVNGFRPNGMFLNCQNWKITKAPAPSEVNWQNVTEHKESLWVIRLILLAFFIIFFFLLVTPATLLQILVEIFEIIGLGSLTEGAMAQLLPSLILLLYQSAIVRHTVLSIVQKEQLGNKSEETVSCMFKYLLVMITYTFLVPLIGLQVYSIITDTFVGGFEEWQSGIANQAAFSGLFFTIFIIHLTFLKNGSDFLQIPKLVRVKIRQFRAVNDRERLMAYEAYEFRWAYEYGVSISALVIILSFSVAYPLILVIGVAFYISRYFTAKYNLLCFYCTVKTTTGHKIPKVVTTSILVAILIFQIFTCALIFLSKSTIYFGLATVMLIFSIVMFSILYYYRDKIEADFQEMLKLESLEEEGAIMGEDISKYYHPLDGNPGQSRCMGLNSESVSDTQLS